MMVLTLLACALLACSLFTRPDEPAKQNVTPPVLPPPTGSPPTAGSAANPYFGQEAQDGGTSTVETETPIGAVAPPVVSETAPGIGTPTMVVPVGYDGPTSLEERIFASPVIARVQLSSATSTVEIGTTYQGTKYIALLEFSFSVQEYLKGSGADDIVAVWAAAPFFDTQQEAEDALPAIAAARDAQWDAHESIVFLQEDSRGFLSSTQQADRYYLAWGGSKMMYADQDDVYSIASRHNKLWLPAAAAVGATSQPTGDQQRFLTDVPPATGTAPTITLGEIKTRIATVTAKLDAGDGSEEYTECVRETYYLERKDRHLREIYPDRGSTGSNISPPHTHQFNSGLGVGTVVYEIPEGDPITPSVPFEVWLDGGDASLFSVANLSQDYRVTTTRPLPGMELRLPLQPQRALFQPLRRKHRSLRMDGHGHRARGRTARGVLRPGHGRQRSGG